jgi:hypothetical protein
MFVSYKRRIHYFVVCNVSREWYLNTRACKKKKLEIIQKIRSKRLKTSYACLLFHQTLRVHFFAIYTSIKLTLLCIFYCTYYFLCSQYSHPKRSSRPHLCASTTLKNVKIKKNYDYNILSHKYRVND